MINLIDELKKAYNGNTWHGNNTWSLLLKADPKKVFTHPIPNAHSIAELVLHLSAWTEEVIDRLNGQSAKEPSRGDWASPTVMSEEEWKLILDDFKSANEKLIRLVDGFTPASWSVEVKDERAQGIADTEVNNAQLLNGLVQHHAYHSGQIALLLKF